MTNRTDVNKILKKLGQQNLRYEDGTVMRITGRMIRAIPVTDKHQENNDDPNNKLNLIIDTLKTQVEATVVVKGSDSTHMISGNLNIILQVQKFPKYLVNDKDNKNQKQSAIEVFYY